MGETIVGKAIASFFAAIAMYWMYIPPSYALLIVLIVTDTVFGGCVAFRDSRFRGRTLFWGLFAKFAAFPMALICDSIEEPLHVGFHLETGFILFVTAFEFISVVQGYADLGGPGAPMLVGVAAKLKDSLKAWAIPASTDAKRVDTTVMRLEMEPTFARPVPPPPVVLTTVKESHVEAIAPEKKEETTT